MLKIITLTMVLWLSTNVSLAQNQPGSISSPPAISQPAGGPAVSLQDQVKAITGLSPEDFLKQRIVAANQNDRDTVNVLVAALVIITFAHSALVPVVALLVIFFILKYLPQVWKEWSAQQTEKKPYVEMKQQQLAQLLLPMIADDRIRAQLIAAVLDSTPATMPPDAKRSFADQVGALLATTRESSQQALKSNSEAPPAIQGTTPPSQQPVESPTSQESAPTAAKPDVADSTNPKKSDGD
jgi:hypothetical protein